MNKLSLNQIASMPWTYHIPVVTDSDSDLENLSAITDLVIATMYQIDCTVQTIINKCWAYVSLRSPMDPRVEAILNKMLFPLQQWAIELDFGIKRFIDIKTMVKLCSLSDFFRQLVEGPVQSSGNTLQVRDLTPELLDFLLYSAINGYESLPFSITTQEIIDWSNAIEQQDAQTLPIPPLFETALLFSRFQCQKTLLPLKQVLYKAIVNLEKLHIEEKFRIALHLFDFLSTTDLNMTEESTTLKLLGGFFGEYLHHYEQDEIYDAIIKMLNERQVKILNIPKFLPKLENLTSLSRLYIRGNPIISNELEKDFELSSYTFEQRPVYSVESQIPIFRLFHAKGKEFFRNCSRQIDYLLKNNFGQYLSTTKECSTLIKHAVVDIAICKLFPEISNYTTLQELTIWGGPDAYDDYVTELDTHDEDLLFLKNLPALSSLILANCKLLNGDGFVHLPPSLKKLTLVNIEKISNEAFANLPACLTHLKIEEVFGNNFLTNEIGEYLNKYPALISLEFISTTNIDEGIRKYFTEKYDLKITF